MTTPLTIEALRKSPGLLTRMLELKEERILLRLLRPEDADILGRYFCGLSEATRRLYGPHPFTMEQAAKLCGEIDYGKDLRFIAIAERGGQPEVVAYFILYMGFREAELKRYRGYGQPIDAYRGCTLAPSVADAYQSRGLGSLIMPPLIEAARRLGCQRMVLSGGTREENHRAIHFYEKFGFRQVGDFLTSDGKVNNHDMIMNLEAK